MGLSKLFLVSVTALATLLGALTTHASQSDGDLERKHAAALAKGFSDLKNPTITSCNLDGNGTVAFDMSISSLLYEGKIRQENGRPVNIRLYRVSSSSYGPAGNPTRIQINFDGKTAADRTVESVSWGRSGSSSYSAPLHSYASGNGSIQMKARTTGSLPVPLDPTAKYALELGRGFQTVPAEFWEKTLEACANGSAKIGKESAKTPGQSASAVSK